MPLPEEFAPPAHIPSLAVYRRIATVFLLLTAAVVAYVFYFAYSRATVVILADQSEIRADFIVDIAKKSGRNEVPGGVYELSDSAVQEFESTSFAKAEAHAEGTVRLTNRLGRAQALVATTRLVNPDGVLFRLKRDVRIPAGGSVEAEVFADAKGTVGDVWKTTFVIPGLAPDLQKLVTAESVGPFAGGVKDIRMITEEDLERATRTLKETLTRDLGEKLVVRAKEEGVPITGSIVNVEVTRQSSDRAVGDEAEKFLMTVTAKATAIFYDKDAFDQQVRASLASELPPGRTLQSVAIDDRQTAVEKRDLVGDRANIHVFGRAVSSIAADADSLDRAKIAGVTVSAATTYLQKLDGVASASIKMSPFWAGRMPSDPERITIEVR